MSGMTGSHTRLVLQLALPAILLFVGAVTGADLTATATATPNVTQPNSWVQVEIEFNQPIDDKTNVILYDKDGEEVYVYKENTPIKYGRYYLNNSSRGYLKDLNVSTVYQSVMVYVRTCSYSPYTYKIVNLNTDLSKKVDITIKYLPEPMVTSGDVEVTELTVQQPGMYTFACKVSNATTAHNLTINTTIDGMTLHQPQQEMGIGNHESCTFSSEATQTHDLNFKFIEEVNVSCTVTYDSGETFTMTVSGQRNTTEEVTSSTAATESSTTQEASTTIDVTTDATESSTTQEASTTIDVTTDDAARQKLSTWIIMTLTGVACVAIIASCVTVIVFIKKKGTEKQLARAAALKQQQPPYPLAVRQNTTFALYPRSGQSYYRQFPQ